jgi:hypothetical protein
MTDDVELKELRSGIKDIMERSECADLGDGG